MRCVLFVVASLLVVAPARAEDLLGVQVDLGPITGTANDSRTITFNAAARTERVLFDAQDGAQHRVRGVPLAELILRAQLPKRADALVFVFENGMQIPVRLADRAVVRDLFIALEHGDAMRNFSTEYQSYREEVPSITCPKVVYSRPGDAFTIWRYPNRLVSVRAVTWSAQQAVWAQPTRQVPTHPAWKIYVSNCQPCHGMGGQGAQRGPDFLSDLDAYRRVPPLAETEGEMPSLHEKVSGRVRGQMPALTHIPKSDVVALWRWLHAVHSGATR